MIKHDIAIVCHNLEVNGANFFALTLANALMKRADVTVYSPRQGAMSERFAETKVNCIIVDANSDMHWLRRYDVVFVNSLMMSRTVLECVKYGIPHSLIVHETWLPEKLSYYIDDLWNVDGVTSSDILQALESSHKVVFPAKYLEQVYESLVPSTRSNTIYCTIEMEMIDRYREANSRAEIRKGLGIDEDEVVFLQVGTITRRKAQLATLKAFHAVYKRFKRTRNISLMLVGARSYRPGEREYIDEIQAYIKECGIEDVVRIYSVSNDIYRFFSASDILIHPSINEVLPLSILEACYFERAVVVSNLDGMPELIQHGVDGMLVNPYDLDTIIDSMVELVNKPELRNEMGRKAREKILSQHAIVGFEKNYNNLVGILLKNNGA